MPVMDCATTVAAAIRSMLNQTMSDWSLILIDDGSTDRTLEQIRAFSDSRIYVHSDGRHLGLPARLNQAIGMATGKYFARMDGDDLCYPERLERQLVVLESSPRLDLVGAGMLVFGPGGKPLGCRIGPETHDRICAHPSSGFPLAHPTWCGRRAWFQAHGYADASRRSQDQDLLLRTWKSSQFANLPEILLGYREERVDLRKVLGSRRDFIGSVARESGGWARLETARATLEQAAKGAVDMLAVAFGAESVILAHRHRPLAKREIVRWRKVWIECNEP
jgi:glycosyltransferase involved in cell wall biosynthesis